MGGVRRSGVEQGKFWNKAEIRGCWVSTWIPNLAFGFHRIRIYQIVLSPVSEMEALLVLHSYFSILQFVKLETNIDRVSERDPLRSNQ